MILDPKKKGLPKEAKDLHYAMIDAVKAIEELKPDLIFMTSPHGIALSNDFGVCLNKGAIATAEWEDDYKDYVVKIEIDQEISSNLLDYLFDKETAVTGIAAYTPGVEVNLRWGDAVPLWFLKDLSTKPKYVLLSQPLRRHDQTEELIPETLCLGNDLRIFFEKLDKMVVIIVSADMGHTHHENGPYGFSEDAASFDALMEEWAESLDANLLVKKAVPKLGKALCCGYIGFVMLQGMLEKKKLKPEVTSRSAPTYYGMMVAKYL
jgi:aromatic ring-opening dioxygenase LigB subunit